MLLEDSLYLEVRPGHAPSLSAFIPKGKSAGSRLRSSDGGPVGECQRRVGGCFDQHQRGGVINSVGDSDGIGGVDEDALDAQGLEHVRQQTDRAPIGRGRADDPVARPAHGLLAELGAGGCALYRPNLVSTQILSAPGSWGR